MKDDLSSQMIEEALLIVKTVDFLENEINKVTEKIDDSIERNSFEEADDLEKKLLSLLVKIEKEDSNMSSFLEKYKKIINEKKTVLSGNKQKK